MFSCSLSAPQPQEKIPNQEFNPITPSPSLTSRTLNCQSPRLPCQHSLKNITDQKINQITSKRIYKIPDNVEDGRLVLPKRNSRAVVKAITDTDFTKSTSRLTNNDDDPDESVTSVAPPTKNPTIKPLPNQKKLEKGYLD